MVFLTFLRTLIGLGSHFLHNCMDLTFENSQIHQGNQRYHFGPFSGRNQRCQQILKIFENRRKLSAYAGIDPSIGRFGSLYARGKIGKKGSRSLRRYL